MVETVRQRWAKPANLQGIFKLASSVPLNSDMEFVAIRLGASGAVLFPKRNTRLKLELLVANGLRRGHQEACKRQKFIPQL
jgi:hypothetical protein